MTTAPEPRTRVPRVEYTSSVERLRAEYVEMREELFGFSDLYAAEWDRIMAAHDAAIWDEGAEHVSAAARRDTPGYMPGDFDQDNPYRTRVVPGA